MISRPKESIPEIIETIFSFNKRSPVNIKDVRKLHTFLCSKVGVSSSSNSSRRNRHSFSIPRNPKVNVSGIATQQCYSLILHAEHGTDHKYIAPMGVDFLRNVLMQQGWSPSYYVGANKAVTLTGIEEKTYSKISFNRSGASAGAGVRNSV